MKIIFTFPTLAASKLSAAQLMTEAGIQVAQHAARGRVSRDDVAEAHDGLRAFLGQRPLVKKESRSQQITKLYLFVRFIEKYGASGLQQLNTWTSAKRDPDLSLYSTLHRRIRALL
jgi:hypothetical protein